MPSYIVTAPDGKEYDVDAPEGATEEQALEYFKSQWSAPKEELPSRTAADYAKDIATTAAKGVISADQALVGIADLLPGVNAGKFLEEHGVDFNKMQKQLSDPEYGYFSPQQQEGNKSWGEAKTLGEHATSLMEHPSGALAAAGEAIPSIMVGGVGGKAVGELAGIKSALTRGAIGEGGITAGQAAEEIRSQSPDKELGAKGELAALGQGAVTGLLGRVGGTLTEKLGGFDPDTLLTGGLRRAVTNEIGEEAAKNPGMVQRTIASIVGEGLFEEAPQSAQEAMWTNYALDRPLLQGVDTAAIKGGILGSIVGGGASVMSGSGEQQAPEQPAVEPVQPTQPQGFSERDRKVDMEDGLELAGVNPDDHPELYAELSDPRHYESEETINALDERLKRYKSDEAPVEGEEEINFASALPKEFDDTAWEAHLEKQREYARQTAPAAEQPQAETVEPEVVEQPQPEPISSVATSDALTEHNVESLQPHLTPEMKRLVASGKLTLHDNMDTLPGEGHPENVQGLTTPQGEVHLVANKLTPETLPKVAMHEMGVHVGMRGMVGDKVWGDLTSQALTTKGEAFDRARQAVPENTPEHLKGEETLAYLVENAPKLPIVRRAISAVKNWARTTFGARLSITESDIRHLAAKALSKESKTSERSTREGTAYARKNQDRELGAQLGQQDLFSSFGKQEVENSRKGMHYKDVLERIPQLTEAANKLKAGEITAKEYDTLVDKYKPVEEYENVPEPATREEMEDALNVNKVPLIDEPSRVLKDGDRVRLRLDIPAYTRKGVWVVTAHEDNSKQKAIGYQSTAVANDVNFLVDEKGGLAIAAKDRDKYPLATVSGKWENMSPEQAKAEADEALTSKDWVQVGMDPERHAYFYDRKTMQPVVHGDRVIQVGSLLMVKNPTYGKKSDFLYSVAPNSKLQEQVEKDRQGMRPAAVKQKKGLKERVLKTTSARNVQNSMDIMETNLLSHDARFVNELRRALEASGRPSAEIGGIMDKASQAQTVSDVSISAQAALLGGMQYEGNTAFWVAVPSKDNVVSMRQLIDDTQAQYGWSEEEANKFFSVYMVSRRLKEMYGKVHSLKAEANKESNDATKKALFKQAREIKEALDRGGVTEEECNKAIESYQSVDKFVEAEAMWHRIRPSVINTLVESGLYSTQKAENYLDAAFYTPMYRVMHESSTEEETENIFDEMANGQYRSNISSLTKGMRELTFKGSKREVFNMMDNIEHWVQISYSRAIRAKKATDLIESARRYMPEGTVTRIHGTKSNKDGAITCYFHGKKQYWKFDDPLMAIAFHGVRAAPLTLKPLQKLTSNLRDSIVLTPTFTIAQLPQDIYSAAFSSGIKNPVKLFTTMLSEFKTTAFSKEDTAAHKILRDIGAVGTKDTIADSRVLHLYDTTHHTHLSKDKSAWRKFKSSLEKFAMAGDNAIRQAVYVRTMEELKGDPRAQSIAYQRAFDVINFRRRGASAAVEQIRCVTPFMGAALQAQRAALQVVAGRGLAYQSAADKKTAHQRLFTTSMVMMTTSFIYNMLYGGLLGSDEDKDKFNKQDIRYKDTHIMMFGADSILSIPVRPDIFALPYITGNHLFSAAITKTENPRQTAQAYREAVAASFGLPLVPPPIKEVIEQITNYDMFTGRPIVQERLKKEDPGYQYDNHTSQLGKLVGMAAPDIMSPVRFDHFMKGWFGGVGTAVLGLSNIAGIMASDNPSKDHTLREIVRMFPSVPNLVPPEHIEQNKASYYDLREDVEGAHATYNAMKKDGRLEDARKYKEEHKNLLNESVHQKMNHLKTATDKIHLNIRKVTNDKKLSSEVKTSRIKALEARERQILSNVQSIYNKVYP
jgi:SOS response regulatory protein OraA/RecX